MCYFEFIPMEEHIKNKEDPKYKPKSVLLKFCRVKKTEMACVAPERSIISLRFALPAFHPSLKGKKTVRRSKQRLSLVQKKNG